MMEQRTLYSFCDDKFQNKKKLNHSVYTIPNPASLFIRQLVRLKGQTMLTKILMYANFCFIQNQFTTPQQRTTKNSV